MKRFRIVGSKTEAPRLIKKLHEFGSFHVTPPAQDPVLNKSGLSLGVFSRETAEKLKYSESLLMDMEAAISVLQKQNLPELDSRQWPPPGGDWLSEESVKTIKSITEQILPLARKIDSLRTQLEEIAGYRAMYEEFLPLIEMVVSSASVELVGVSFPREFQEAYTELETELERVTGGAYSIFKSDAGAHGSSALVICPTKYHEEVMRRVIGKKSKPVHLPERYSRETFATTLKGLFEEEKSIRSELNELSSSLDRLALGHLAALQNAYGGVKLAVVPLKTQDLLAHSESAFWLSGWVPVNKSSELNQVLEHGFPESAQIYSHDPSPGEFDVTPVKLKNFFWAKPFERLIGVYSLPQYGVMDPTTIMGITFPLFFGIILGDVGYAATLAGIGFFMKHRWPGNAVIRDCAFIVLLCAVSSALMGIIYGEFFGKMWLRMGLPPPLFHRKDEIVHMLYLVMFLGGCHLILGAFLGVLNGIKLKSFGKTVEKAGDMLLLSSLLWIAFLGINGHGIGWWGLLPALAFLLKLVSGNIMETILEAPRLLTSVLSYARLMALGLASVILADLADDALKSGIGVVPAVFTMVLIHGINFLLGVFSPAIQSLRLHFVEFFSLFYIPGGTPFAPLRSE